MKRPILLEDNRAKLKAGGKKGANYSPTNRHRGRNRHERRVHSKLASSVKQFNSINMDKFFKEDILDVNIDVKGETNVYVVRMSFMGTLDELHNYMQAQKIEVVTKEVILKALMRSFNRDDVYIRCSCPDFRYRFAYWATRNNLIIGDPETIPSDETNPNNDKGPGCKHILLALNDASWLIKVASVIYNYINYMRNHNARLYQKFIYPAIYQKPFEFQQLDLIDDEDDIIDSEKETIDTANAEARKRGQFQKGNKYRFQKKPDGNDQITFDDLEDEEDPDDLIDNDEE